MLRVEILIGCQVVCDCGCGLTEHIRHDRIKCHIAYGKGLLKTVFLATFHRSEFVAVAGQFSQDTDVLGWDKAAFHQTNAEQVPNPFGILCIVFVSFHRLHPFGVSHDDADTMFFQNIKHGHPTFPSGFHACIHPGNHFHGASQQI